MKAMTFRIGGRHRITAVRFGSPAGRPLAYDRVRDLPRLLPLMIDDLDVKTFADHARLLGRLRDALRKERTRGRHGHWCYDVGRHAALLAAYRYERALLHELRRRPVGASPEQPEAKSANRWETKSIHPSRIAQAC
jgi:hypothetical protein